MSDTRRERVDDRALARAALKRAPGPGKPDVTRLLDAVPALMAEARRRRASAWPDRPESFAARAWVAIPKLAAAAALLGILGAAALLIDSERSTSGRTGFDSMILTSANEGGSDDVLLEAMMEAE